jgi:hypothetical protein
MATAAPSKAREISSNHIRVFHLTATVALTAGVVFLFCWLGTLIPASSPTHTYINLFTNAPADSVRALLEGLVWSVLFGGLVGVVFSVIYNALPVGRR